MSENQGGLSPLQGVELLIMATASLNEEVKGDLEVPDPEGEEDDE